MPAIREVDRTLSTAPPTTRDRLVQIIFDGPDRWLCVWVVNGKEKQVAVSDAVRADIKGKAAFRAILDALRDDTHPRAIV